MTVNGTYGSNKTPCEVFVYEIGSCSWYCVDGSKIINCTYEEISDGVNVEMLNNVDCFTWSSSIGSYGELVEAVES